MRTLVVRLALAAVLMATLGACVTIPERAWANGQAMSQSRAYRQAAAGDMSLATHRQLRMSADPLRLRQRDLPYRPFTEWR